MRDVQYDPDVIQRVANDLDQRARAAVARLIMLGMLFGGLGGYTTAVTDGAEPGPWAVGGTVLGLAIGYFIGQARALALRAATQRLLALRAIERNTRPPRPDPAPEPDPAQGAPGDAGAG